MKKKACMVLAAFITIALGQAKASPVAKEGSLLTTKALVCFVDFRVGLVVGKSEAEISNRKYCRYSIDRKAFLSLLKPMPTSTFYMGGNVRAKVSFSEKNVYYIDYNGVVRHNEDKFQIDKSGFTKALRREGEATPTTPTASATR